MRTASEIAAHDLRLTAIELIVEACDDEYYFRWPKGHHWKTVVRSITVRSMPNYERWPQKSTWVDLCQEIRRTMNELAVATAESARGTSARCIRFRDLVRAEHNARRRKSA